MKCPYCGEELYMYEQWDDRNEEDHFTITEHWECSSCDHTFSRNMTYKLIEKGTLEE